MDYRHSIGYPDVKYESVTIDEVGPSDDSLRRRVSDLRDSNERWRRFAHTLTFIYRLASALLSAFLLGTLTWSLVQYFQTKGLTLANGTHVWPSNLVLWPTYLLLGVSLVTFVTNGLLLCIPCMHRRKKVDEWDPVYGETGVRAARKRTQKLLSTSQYLATALYFIAWAVSSGLYQFANTGDDLWGCTCSAQAHEIQPQVDSFLNFGKLCSVQGASWNVMLAHAAVWALAGVTYVVAAWRWTRRRTLRRLEEEHRIRQSVVSYLP